MSYFRKAASFYVFSHIDILAATMSTPTTTAADIDPDAMTLLTVVKMEDLPPAYLKKACMDLNLPSRRKKDDIETLIQAAVSPCSSHSTIE